MTLILHMKNGKQVVVESTDSLAFDALYEINGRTRGHAQRVARLDSVNAPRISELRNLKFNSSGYAQWIEHSRTTAKLRDWLLDRLGITEADIESTPGNSGQFDFSLSVVRPPQRSN